MELTHKTLYYARKTADISLLFQQIQIAHLTSVPYFAQYVSA